MASAGERLTIIQPIGFEEGAFVRDAVRDECQLQTKIPQFIGQYANGAFNIVAGNHEDAVGVGKVLTLTIIGADETGNIWTGRHKTLTIRGEFRENGQLIGSFRARRSTMGGFAGGWKGSCAFFGRCAKTIGKDVARWLQSPALDSQLGG